MKENKIMEDQLISFETAKLAKEKGFDKPSFFCFYNGILGNTISLGDKSRFESYEINKMNINHNWYDLRYSAPTQSLLQKWLREKHNISVIVLLDDTLSYYWHIIPLSPDCIIQKQSISLHVFCDKYESALEDGLKFALTEMEL